MPGSDPMWFCYSCNAEMRPTTLSPQPLCASCGSDFVEQLSNEPNADDDPRVLGPMSRLFEGASTQGHFHDEPPNPRGVGGAIDPIANILGAMFGMRNIAPETPPASTATDQTLPGSGSGRPTISIRRRSSEQSGGRSNSGSGFQFSFRSGTGGTNAGFGVFGGSNRQERNDRQEPQNLEELMATLFPGAPPPPNAQGRPPLLHHMLMGLFGAGIGNPGIGMGAHGDGRWGDYALNQEALDRIITQLMEGNNPAPVPAPDDMIAAWPRTILTPGNPLENEDCAVCKDGFAYIPPESDGTASSSKDEPPQPQEALTLPCRHSFHVECIEPWVKVKGTCPVCRYELVSQDRRNSENQNQNPGSGDGGGNNPAGGNQHLRPVQQDNRGESGSPMPPGAYELD
ncbi:Zf-rbx1 domain-containing protein [Ceratobasidium sp. AG-Ba]|nr:Zf-rbx1 domain-containing protein [Ceratobasidium sp. AG-Ba]